MPPLPSPFPHHHCNKMFARKKNLKRLMILKLCLIFSRQVEVSHSKLLLTMGKDPDSDDVPPPNQEWRKHSPQCILPEVKEKYILSFISGHIYTLVPILLSNQKQQSACTFTYTSIGLLYVTICVRVCSYTTEPAPN